MDHRWVAKLFEGNWRRAAARSGRMRRSSSTEYPSRSRIRRTLFSALSVYSWPSAPQDRISSKTRIAVRPVRDQSSQPSERGQAAALRAGDPAVEQPCGLGGSQVGVEHRAQRLLELIGAPARHTGVADGGELVLLGVGQVVGVAQQRPAGVLELLGRRRVGGGAQVVQGARRTTSSSRVASATTWNGAQQVVVWARVGPRPWGRPVPYPATPRSAGGRGHRRGRRRTLGRGGVFALVGPHHRRAPACRGITDAFTYLTECFP